MFKKLKQWILRTPKLGLLPQPEDDRDMGYSLLSLFGSYEPQHTEKILDLPYPAKFQKYNTCGWVSSTAGKELDEQVELDERAFVMLGKESGYISGDGYSYLRNNERVLNEKGIPKEGLITASYYNWSTYSDPSKLNQAIREDAEKHKTKSYSRIYNVNEIYKAIDDGRPVKIGVKWRTSFNMGGGFKYPWILNFNLGTYVGGHATLIRGYNQKYLNIDNNKCFRGRNSYGAGYGDNGDFWIKEEDLQKQIDFYGAYVNYDLEKDMIKWLAQHQGKLVSGHNDPNVYLIEGDKKRLFPDLATLYAHGWLDEDITHVEPDYISSVEDGEPMNFWDGQHVKAVKAIIQQEENLKPIFSKYFNELF